MILVKPKPMLSLLNWFLSHPVVNMCHLDSQNLGNAINKVSYFKKPVMCCKKTVRISCMNLGLL